METYVETQRREYAYGDTRMSTTASDYMAYTIWMLEEMAKNYKEYLEPQAVYLAVVLFM